MLIREKYDVGGITDKYELCPRPPCLELSMCVIGEKEEEESKSEEKRKKRTIAGKLLKGSLLFKNGFCQLLKLRNVKMLRYKDEKMTGCRRH